MRKILLTVGLGCLLAPASLQAQGKLSPNASHYLLTRTSRAARTPGVQDKLNAYLHLSPATDREALRRAGVEVNTDLGDMLTARVSADCLAEVAALPGVRYVQLSSAVRPMMDKARAASGADRVAMGEGLSGAYAASGVVVGIIDAGFDYTHPAFLAADGQTLRIKRVWEQSYTGGTPPEGFTYGSELSTSEDILRSGGDVVTNSHGTHVAGIVAGAALGNGWQGIATDADIVLVSKGEQTQDNVNISDAIAYIYRYAESVGKPCVINMSLGMQIGPHDGTSAFDQVADRLQGAGRLLVGSSGNFGHEKLHLSKTFASADDAPLRSFFDFKLKPSAANVGGQVDIWGEAGMSYEVQAVVVSASSGEVIAASEPMDASLPEGATQTLELTKNSKGSILLTTEVNPLNGKPHTLLTLNLTNLRNGYEAGIIVTPRSAGTVHAWADDIYVRFTNSGKDDWQDGDTQCTIAEIGGTGREIISVGAYTTRDVYTTAGSTREERTGEVLGAIATFSGTGPTPDGRMKPDVAAPGTFIVSAVSSNDVTLTSLPLAGSVEHDGKSYCYAYMQGTSMAAPHVAGVVATWLQADPSLTPAAVRSVLAATAVQDEFTGQIGAGNGIWGCGKIDAYEGLKKILAASSLGGAVQTEAARPLFRTDGTSLRLLFTADDASRTLRLCDLSGRTLRVLNVTPRRGAEVVLPVSALPAGCYVLHVGEHSFKFRR